MYRLDKVARLAKAETTLGYIYIFCVQFRASAGSSTLEGCREREVCLDRSAGLQSSTIKSSYLIAIGLDFMRTTEMHLY